MRKIISQREIVQLTFSVNDNYKFTKKKNVKRTPGDDVCVCVRLFPYDPFTTRCADLSCEIN